MIDKELDALFDEFIKKAKQKGYKKEDIDLLGLLALSKKAVEKYGTSKESFRHLIKLTEQCKTSQEALDKFTLEIGLE